MELVHDPNVVSSPNAGHKAPGLSITHALQAGMLGKLIEVLVEKGILNIYDVNKIVGPEWMVKDRPLVPTKYGSDE